MPNMALNVCIKLLKQSDSVFFPEDDTLNKVVTNSSSSSKIFHTKEFSAVHEQAHELKAYNFLLFSESNRLLLISRMKKSII